MNSFQKISKSIGNVLTPQKWLEYGTPDSLLLLMFKRISGAYARAAKMRGVHPNVLQAQTWLQWRIDKGITRQAGVRI